MDQMRMIEKPSDGAKKKEDDNVRKRRSSEKKRHFDSRTARNDDG
jgi:hypothetical protein